MGTPDFAVGTLEAIIEAGHEVVLVVTQPDKPKGRGKAMQYTPVKECALAHGIEVFQPDRVRKPEHLDYLETFAPDIIVVAAFGQILPKRLLDLPKTCCINVHASILPKYRGAAPIQWADINGDEISGVTIQRMDVGIDTGDIVTIKELALDPAETGGSLFDRLAVVGAEACIEAMKSIEEGTAVFTPQDHTQATHVGMISKEMGRIDWSKDAASIERLIRGLNPWPSAYTSLGGKTLKLWRAQVVAEDSGKPWGSIIRRGKNTLLVQTGQGMLSLLELQLEGKKRMDVAAFLNGYPLEEGTLLGEEG